MADCKVCRAKLSNDEIAVTRKLVGMCEQEYYCKKCLADKFRVDVGTIDEKIRQFRRNGCWLFPPEEERSDERTESQR
ncbi:MAG: hypothetical protein IJU75_02305 [Clostridia bacterium]|nr:hypothetical protein [Clostridia bacterium]MBQ7603764.1 hypothetical protein [Clostridia bacterium]